MNQANETSAAPGAASRLGGILLAAVILLSLLLYFVGDRITPYTSQARIQAFVVPVAAEVAGKFSQVHVSNNDEVQPGQPLFDIDARPYEIALQAARADYESVRSSVNASSAAVDAAHASLQAAIANRDMAERDARRQEHLYAEDPGAISVRRLEIAQSTREEARSKVHRAEADLRQAQEAAGDTGDNNTQLQSARAAVDKAELDLSRTRVFAPARGIVTDLQSDVGHFAQPGAPVMTLIARHDLWISADMTENNLGQSIRATRWPSCSISCPVKCSRGVCAASAVALQPASQQTPAPCLQSTTTATGCGRRSASPWSLILMQRTWSGCPPCLSAARRMYWSTPAITRC